MRHAPTKPSPPARTPYDGRVRTRARLAHRRRETSACSRSAEPSSKLVASRRHSGGGDGWTNPRVQRQHRRRGAVRGARSEKGLDQRAERNVDPSRSSHRKASPGLSLPEHGPVALHGGFARDTSHAGTFRVEVIEAQVLKGQHAVQAAEQQHPDRPDVTLGRVDGTAPARAKVCYFGREVRGRPTRKAADDDGPVLQSSW